MRSRDTIDTIHDSPLRYPGGKASLAAFLARTIELNGLAGCSYFEPFAGGAGAALRLLKAEVVSEIYLNDWDPCIAAFWKAALTESERFAAAIQSVPLNISEWRRQQGIYAGGGNGNAFELGFATFYLNRCNRSGMLAGAGPIGGYEQTGSWKIDSRFNRENLAARILELGRKRDRIRVTNLDALPFWVKSLPRGRGRSSVFAYLDPPYCAKGNRVFSTRVGIGQNRGKLPCRGGKAQRFRIGSRPLLWLQQARI